MLKVNLQNELVKQNKSLVSARELLLIKEYDRTALLADNEIIKRVFGGLPAAEGGEIKKRANSLLLETKHFKQENVFHISQIEKLCKKYHLRFLPSVLFKGQIDEDLTNKISQFEICYGTDCKKWEVAGDRWSGIHYREGNTYIAAPAKSFHLQEKPKDPLMFFRINSDYYYLIHKWGNDVSLVRRFYKLLSSWFVSMLAVAVPAILLGIGIWLKYGDRNEKASFPEVVSIVLFVGAFAIILVNSVCQSDGFTITEENDWRSEYKIK